MGYYTTGWYTQRSSSSLCLASVANLACLGAMICPTILFVSL